MGDNAYFRGGAGMAHCLPLSVPVVDEARLLRRCWELLVLDRGGAQRLAALGRAPLCRTVLLPTDAGGGFLRARQLVDCGLSRHSSLTLSGLLPSPVLCVQRRLITVTGEAVEPQEIPLPPSLWGRLPPETLLLAAGAWLLTDGAVPAAL